MKRNKRLVVRVDERTAMLVSELSEITGMNISVIIRGMVTRSIEGLIDESGNWKLPYAKGEGRECR